MGDLLMLTISGMIAIVSLCAIIFGLGYKCNDYTLYSFNNNPVALNDYTPYSFHNNPVALIGKSHHDKK